MLRTMVLLAAGCTCNAQLPAEVLDPPAAPTGVDPGEPVCGDGVVEGDERCDGDCPTACEPAAPGSCAVVTSVGSVDACTAACEVDVETTCVGGDGCCPDGCGTDDDRDCVPPGTILWQVPLEGGEPTTPAVGDDAVFVGVRTAGRMMALEPSDGAVRWSFDTGWWWLSAPAVADDGTVLFGSGALGVVALDPTTGAVRWTFDRGGAGLSTPALGPDGEVYTQLADERLYALDLTDGRELWRVDLGTPFSGDQASVAVLADGTVIAAARSGRVVGVRDGVVEWSFTASYPFQTSPAVGDDGVVYLAGNDFLLYAVEPGGDVGWTLPLDRMMDGAPVITDDGILEAGGSVLRRFVTTGSELPPWDELYLTGTPAVGVDGTVLVPGLQTVLFALDRDGRELWRIVDGAWGGYRVGPALAPDGTVYMGRTSSAETQHRAVLYAVASGTVPPPAGRWSTEQGDVRRTGRVPAR